MKITVRIVVMLLLMVIWLCCLTSCDFVNTIKGLINYGDMKDYMKDVPQNDNVVYVDGSDTIYFHDKVVDLDVNGYDFLYVTGEHIYFSTYNKGYVNVYKANHELTDKVLLMTYETGSDGTYMFMRDENKIFYGAVVNGIKYHVYFIEKNETQIITKERFSNYRNENDYYSVKVQKAPYGGIKAFEITSKSTGEMKYINENFLQEILKIEEAKKLEEYSYLYYKDYILKDDQIYIACASGDFITVYQYNFETEEVTFVDWMNMRDIEYTEIIDIYVL